MPDTGGNHGGSGTNGKSGDPPAPGPAPEPKKQEIDLPKIAALRVQEYVAPEKGKSIGTAGRAVATLHKSDMKEPKSTLKTIRDMLRTMLPEDALLDQKFCYADGSLAKDDLTLDQYSLVLNEDIAPTKVTETILIEPVPRPIVKPPEPPTATGILTGGTFLIHAFQWQIGANGQSLIDKGVIHSKTLTTVDMTTLKLSGLRKMITSMSPIPKIHYFCSSTGTTVEDESLLFTDYLALSPVQPSDKDLTGTTSDASAAVDDSKKPDLETTSEPAKSTKPAAVQVYYKKNSILNNPTKLEMPENLKALNSNLSDEKKTQLKLDAFQSQESQWKELFPTEIITGSDINARTAQSLTDLEWYEVLTNCSVFYGWFVDRASNRIVRAPKPAFRLKKPASSTSAAANSDFEAPSAATRPDATSAAKSLASDAQPTNNTPANPGTTGASTAGSGTAGSNASGHTPDNPPNPGSTSNAPAPDSSGSVPNSSAPAPPAAGDLSVLPLSTKPSLGIPNYQVQDESSIEITACQHEFENSMAHNDFSASTVEASMSGGFGGYAVSVTASHSESHSSSIKTSSQTFTKTIVARYLFPRCELSIFPRDVEPTPELSNAIDQVCKTKNLRDLSKIHSEFGHIFCQRLTLGGRLLSTKTILSTDNRSEDQQKSEFKTAVGVSVSTPYGGASVTATQSGGSSQEHAAVEIKKSESDVWTAQGGNTILANNVVAWAPTVADYRLWRVINRDSVVSLADAIAGMDGYAQVKAWFVQAVPDVAKFIRLDPSRQTRARFKLTSPLNNLSLHNPHNPDVFSNSPSATSLTVPDGYPNADAFYYLGHDGTSTGDGRMSLGVEPRKLYVDTSENMDQFWGILYEHIEHTNTNDRKLFTPATWQAPTIIGYRDSQVGDYQYGTVYDAAYTNTEWTITAPFTDALTHGSRVILQNQKYAEPDPAPNHTATAATTPAPPPAVNDPTPTGPHMAVFRNQQGVFLPYMSQETTPQYWRILKKSGGDAGQHLQGGDEVRLAWAFADQVIGFRDFFQDAFGRKRAQCPPELVNVVLYLKLPWPRFENYQFNSPRGLNTMFMHQTPDTAETSITMYTHMAEDSSTLLDVEVAAGDASGLPHLYVAQDVSFRIDPVDNDGYGDTNDYMLRGVLQGHDSKTIQERYQFGNDWSYYTATSFYI